MAPSAPSPDADTLIKELGMEQTLAAVGPIEGDYEDLLSKLNAPLRNKGSFSFQTTRRSLVLQGEVRDGSKVLLQRHAWAAPPHVTLETQSDIVPYTR